jgi:hypothetical protein
LNLAISICLSLAVRWRPLAAEGAAGATAFPLAVPGVAVSRVAFDGVGDLRALCGEAGNARAGFVFLLK